MANWITFAFAYPTKSEADSVSPTAAQVVLIPPADARRVIKEFMPQLPENLGNGPSTVLTHGIVWAAVGLSSVCR